VTDHGAFFQDVARRPRYEDHILGCTRPKYPITTTTTTHLPSTPKTKRESTRTTRPLPSMPHNAIPQTSRQEQTSHHKDLLPLHAPKMSRVARGRGEFSSSRAPRAKKKTKKKHTKAAVPNPCAFQPGEAPPATEVTAGSTPRCRRVIENAPRERRTNAG